MSQQVGQIYYEVTLETSKMIAQSRQVGAQVGKVAEGFVNLAAKITPVAAAIILLATATKALQMARVADEIRMLGARVQVAAGSMQAGAEAMRELEAISTRTRSSVAANADVFARLNQSLLQMGGTQKDTLQLTELLGKGIAASGAKGQEAESAMRQFGQAMGTGKLSGDELNSMLENSQYLMQKLAQGMGVPVGALKKLGADGKLTADVLLEAFGKMSGQIDEDFKKLPATIESTSVVAQDAADRLSKALDDVSGTSAAMTGVIQGAGTVLNELAEHISGASGAADGLGRNKAIAEWASGSVTAISYLVDAADVVWQTVSVLGRNVAFVLKGIGTEIGGIGAQIKAVMTGDFAGAAAIGMAMKEDAAARRKENDAADAATINRPLAGAAVRQSLQNKTEAGGGAVNFTTIKPPKEDDKKKPKGGGGLAAAARRLALGDLQNTMREELAMLDAQQGQLDLRRQAGLMGETDYYAQKRTLLAQANELEAKALQDQIARLEKEKTKGKESLDVQQQIGTLKAKLAVQQANAQNKTAALDQTAAAAAAKHRAEIESLTQAHARYLAQLDEAANRRVAVVGMSSKGAGRAQGEWGIEDKYNDEERDMRNRKLTSGNEWTPENQAAFDLRLSQLKIEKQKEIDVYRNTFSAIDALEADWRTGAGRSVQEYADRAGNVAQQTQDAFTNAFQGMEDALVQFAMTGKLDFKSLANSIIADLIRIQIRASMMKMFAGMFGGMSGGSALASSGVTVGGVDGMNGYASGGYTGPGGKYQPAGIVHAGEYVINAESTKKLGRGYLDSLNGYAQGGLVAAAPVPRVAGGALGAGAQVDVQIEVNNYGAGEVKQRQETQTMPNGDMLRRFVIDIIAEDASSGGKSARAMKGRFGLQDA